MWFGFDADEGINRIASIRIHVFDHDVDASEIQRTASGNAKCQITVNMWHTFQHLFAPASIVEAAIDAKPDRYVCCGHKIPRETHQLQIARYIRPIAEHSSPSLLLTE